MWWCLRRGCGNLLCRVFDFGKARIVGGNEGVMGGLRGPDGMREEGTGNLLGNEG